MKIKEEHGVARAIQYEIGSAKFERQEKTLYCSSGARGDTFFL
jgi:hypothetical protein